MHKVDYLNDIEGTRKLALWHARPWTYRLRYRYNVLRALLSLHITIEACRMALEHSFRVVVVPMRPPHQGMLIVCPEFADEFFQMNRSAQSTGLEKAPDELDQPD